ncbi:MAG: HepT-like ribonuclease domain-containing protein [Armatimonadota bacterium]
MLDAANEAVSFVQDMDAEAFAENRLVQLAVVRCIEIIGEAAGYLTPEFQHAHADIPWPQIKGMRNRLIHAYFDINYALVWKTVAEVLPSFIPTLEHLVHELENER